MIGVLAIHDSIKSKLAFKKLQGPAQDGSEGYLTLGPAGSILRAPFEASLPPPALRMAVGNVLVSDFARRKTPERGMSVN
jgi:hypothetical protein